jgi:hypothetical protein
MAVKAVSEKRLDHAQKDVFSTFVLAVDHGNDLCPA